MMVRSFLPVGQGAFYVEKFKFGDKKVNVVYDCGSSTNLSLLKREIENNFCKDEIINAVFISHLHNDHINGLEYLMQYCKVKNIFLPFVTEENKKYILLEYLIQSKRRSNEDFVYKFIQNPYYYHATIYMVSEHNADIIHNSNNNQFVPSGNDVSSYVFNTKLDNTSKWEYVPYNFNQEIRLKDLKLSLEKEFNREIDSTELEDLWKTNEKRFKNKIKNAYNNLQGSLNSNSMVLFSGSRNDGIIQYPFKRMYAKNCYCGCDDCFLINSGCLYMGDYNANIDKNWNDMLNYIKPY